MNPNQGIASRRLRGQAFHLRAQTALAIAMHFNAQPALDAFDRTAHGVISTFQRLVAARVEQPHAAPGASGQSLSELIFRNNKVRGYRNPSQR